MGKVKKYILEVLILIALIAIGITLIACSGNDDIDAEPSPTPIPEATEEPEETPEPTVEPTPEPTEEPLEFETGGKEYFDDALFIGDSRTVGIKEYADMGNATFFCSVGMNSFKIFDEAVDVNGVGTVTLKQLLEQKQFGKVYILLGINELGSDLDIITEKITELEEYVKQTQPDALIFIQANMHVTAKKSSSDKTFNNERINELNNKLAARADEKKVFYIDVNEHFDDENGCLRGDISGDGIHVTAKGYIEWGDWLCTKQIYTPEMRGITEEITQSPTPVPTASPTPKPSPSPTATPTKAPVSESASSSAVTSGNAYFDDTLFIGDSRTVGLRDYANMGNATFFCSVGLNSFRALSDTVDVKGVGSVTLKQLLQQKQFGKIYILFGINEIGSDLDTVANKITGIADYVKGVQPNAKIVMQANLHVTAKKDASGDVFTNERIDALNKKLAAYSGAVYIDANVYFDDENGCLPSNISGDGIHITANAYKEWGNWIAAQNI